MEKEFVTYEQALALKELDFDEPCFGRYDGKGKYKGKIWYEMPNQGQYTIPVGDILAPTYPQTFRWFREKYDLRVWIESNIKSNHGILKFEYVIATTNPIFLNNVFDDKSGFKTYEEAEIACLNKIIEIIKNK